MEKTQTDLEREAIVWCPHCHIEKYEIMRQPLECEGVCEHVLKWPSGNGSDRNHLICLACNTPLERKYEYQT